MMVLLPTSRTFLGRHWLLMLASALAALSAFTPHVLVKAECLSDPALDAEFVSFIEGAESIPLPDSCCQADVCGIPCPEELEEPGVGYGVAIGVAIGLSFLVGVLTTLLVHGDAENYFIAGKSLPLWIVSITLGAQAIESGSLLTNVDLSYRYHFWDGAMIPIGIGLSLWVNALLLARHMNAEKNVLTLPDVLSKKYGKITELITSLICVVSFIFLLSSNLVGLGSIMAYLWGISERAGIWLAAFIVWSYTIGGGLFSVAYTDVVQCAVGWSGCLICAYYLVVNFQGAPEPSVGFPGYVYPNQEICDLYDGVQCEYDTSACCYNTSKWCSDPDDTSTCTNIDNGAYPFGDKRQFSDQQFNPQALSPFPNAIYYNWVTLIILALGNLAAIDFQVRCMAAKSPRASTLGCLIGGAFTFFIGIPFSYVGAVLRTPYGPDSARAAFEADSCSEILGLPTCGLWVPDDSAFVKLLTHEAPAFLGAWCLIGIVTASMSTADGAILAMGTVWAHNIVRQLDAWFPNLVTPATLLQAARFSTVPLTLAATLIADQVRETGYLLIVAFDIVLAAVVMPLLACYYTRKTPSPRAALVSVIVGVAVRIILEFTLPKDGYLILPYNSPEFVDYGPAASSLFPPFFDVPAADIWDPVAEPCVQPQLEDFTGVDSLAAFVASIIAFWLVHWYEWGCLDGRSMFDFPGMQPYEKDLGPGHTEDDTKRTKQDNVKNDESGDDDDVYEKEPSEAGA